MSQWISVITIVLAALAGWYAGKNMGFWNEPKPKTGPWKASCYCGWVSNAYPTSEWAIAELDDHKKWSKHWGTREKRSYD